MPYQSEREPVIAAAAVIVLCTRHPPKRDSANLLPRERGVSHFIFKMDRATHYSAFSVRGGILIRMRSAIAPDKYSSTKEWRELELEGNNKRDCERGGPILLLHCLFRGTKPDRGLRAWNRRMGRVCSMFQPGASSLYATLCPVGVNSAAKTFFERHTHITDMRKKKDATKNM